MLGKEAVLFISPFWTYWSVHFQIRQSRYVSVRESEPLVTPFEFPLAVRYSDLLHLLSLLCLMIACDGPSPSLFTIAAACLLLVYTVYVYFVDKYRLLRVYRQTYYMSPKLDSTVQYIMLVPLSILVILPLQLVPVKSKAFWVAQFQMQLVPIFLANILIYVLIVWCTRRCSEPQRELGDIPYVEVASLVPFNYFNTNAVHVLRAMHFPSIVVPPIYPYMPGKEYLHGGQFADYDDSVRLRETLMLLVKSPLKGMSDLGNPQDIR